MEQGFIATSTSNYPEISAVVVLVLGLLAAVALRTAAQRGLEALDRTLSRASTSSAGFLTPTLIRFAKAAAFWTVILLTIVAALRLLGVDELSLGLDSAVAFVPRLLGGLVIIGAGHLLGLLGRSLVSGLEESLRSHSLLPRFAYWTIMVIAIVTGLEQMRFDITFVTQLLLVLVAVCGAGLMLAFALGSRQQVSNVMAQSFLQRFSVGERIRVDDIEGTIAEIHATGVELTTSEGTASVPAARFAEATVARISVSESDDA